MDVKIFVGVGGVLIKDNKVLLQRRAQTSPSGGVFWFPGGHVDGNETIRQALARELFEEVGITIDPEQAQFMHVSHNASRGSGREYVTFNFLITAWQGEPVNKEPDKHDLLDWFPLDQLPAGLHPQVPHILKSYQDKIYYSELGWER